MADLKVIEGGAAKKVQVGLAVRAAIFLLAIETFGAILFQGLWVAFAAPRVAYILSTAQLPNLGVAVGQMLLVNTLPLALTILAILTPLFGWWIYSRVPAEKQTGMGWTLAAIFTAGHVALGLLAGLQAGVPYDAIAWIAYWFGGIFAYVVVLLWVMFFMGAGFLIAKLFKSKL
ncbi:MAG TPA: hypothetical protein VG672_12400 [Bryobacteraceae bacterium]|nr:hypothetical protein [Bryobacteraceae bacterium]